MMGDNGVMIKKEFDTAITRDATECGDLHLSFGDGMASDSKVIRLACHHVPIKECLKCQRFQKLRHRRKCEVKGMASSIVSRSTLKSTSC